MASSPGAALATVTAGVKAKDSAVTVTYVRRTRRLLRRLWHRGRRQRRFEVSNLKTITADAGGKQG
jgi:hypothetical protein